MKASDDSYDAMEQRLLARMDESYATLRALAARDDYPNDDSPDVRDASRDLHQGCAQVFKLKQVRQMAQPREDAE